MYLKSLEIQGFKSFPEKTRLSFDKPITGIVGPNGSGKSNISDAILWVMGEQSTRTLRGGKMEDVIFGGTQRRAPVGFAEVSLILDNSEGLLSLDNNEVMITRRYYRSGESEYYINRSLVRLRDVNELLMDTGLGREGYSIIGQGKIDAILSAKSRERREIFEEAAGISRYRHRKEESERKLSQTDENLLRINDKISELELQVEPLREQAETAKKYLLLRDELRGLEISVWLCELENLRERAEKLESDHITARRELENAAKNLEDGYARAESISEDMRRCDVDADSVRERISSAETRLNEQASAVAVLKSQLEGNIAQVDRLGQELQNQENRKDGIGAQISERENRLREIAFAGFELDKQADGLLSELEAITSSAGESAGELSRLMKSESELRDTISGKKSELSALASQAQELYDRENSVKLELTTMSERLILARNEFDSCKAELKKAQDEREGLANIISGYNIKADNRRKKADAAAEKRDKLSFELKTLQSRKTLLSDMEKEYQGYSRAVRLVMQESARGVLKNVHGTVAQLLRTEDRYTAAIETALGGALQNIIVETDEDGKTAITFLKRRDGGRATFLPISTVRGGVLNESEVGGDPGFEGIALNLVGFDAKYAGVYASLLGRTIVADDLNSAVRIAKRHSNRYKVVTLDGQVINAGGSMTGGSAVSNAGILSRTNELKQLDGRIGALTETLSAAEREFSECIREKNAAEYELETARAELRTIEDRLIKLESGESHYRLLLESAEAGNTAFQNELGTIGVRIKNNSAETDLTRIKITELESSAGTLRLTIEEVVRGQETLMQARDNVNTALSGIKAEKASLEAERDALIQAVSELSALRDEMSGSRDRQLETIEGLKRRNEEIREDILDRNRISESVGGEIEAYKRRLSEFTDKKLSLEAERVNLNKVLQEKNQGMLELERECSRFEQRILAAQMEEKQIVDRLWDSYELSRSTAMNLRQPIENLTEAQKSITRIKRGIAELGSPNIGAIEEFERVNTRYLFLTSQRDDVEKAKNELTGIIGDITEHMRDIFTREFKVICVCFEKTFKELFGGGKASLILEEPDDVLNCGIEIEVQPPGKSLKTLTLLSGGEKAFVAIALYFAILTVRPTPFVVMDEIEAALDDANVLRFAEYMRRMSQKTQMIVISHRRGTMEEADVLYGVTMQEMGVSRILHLDLEEAERHIKMEPAIV